jgi:hypothetical protein
LIVLEAPGFRLPLCARSSVLGEHIARPRRLRSWAGGPISGRSRDCLVSGATFCSLKQKLPRRDLETGGGFRKLDGFEAWITTGASSWDS